MSLKDKSVGYYLAYSPGLTPSNLADDSTHAFKVLNIAIKAYGCNLSLSCSIKL